MFSVRIATWTWAEIVGVQMQGLVEVVPDGAAWQAAWHFYVMKFPFVAKMQGEVSRSQFYVFTPRWTRLIDNRRGFGYKFEIGMRL